MLPDQPVTDFLLVSVAGSEYAGKWRLKGRPTIYKMGADKWVLVDF